MTFLHNAGLIVMLATEVSEFGDDIVSIYQNIIEAIIFRLAAVISDGKKSGNIISMLDSSVLAREIVHMWLDAAIMDCTTGATRERQSNLKIMRALLYSQFY